MGKKSSPSPPPAPDPVAIANAQTSANKEAIYASADVNSYNQYTPYGSVTYQKDNNGVPQSQTVSLNPTSQAAFDQSQQIALDLMGRAQNNLQYLPQGNWQLPQQFSPQQLQQRGDFGYDPESYNERTSALSQAMFDRRMDLMRPELDRQYGDLEQNLANRGLPMSGEAYGTAMDRFDTNRREMMLAAAQDAQMAASQEERALRGQDMAQWNADYNNYLNSNQQAYSQDMGTQQQLTSDSLLQRNQPYQEMLAYIQGSPITSTPNAPQLPAYQMQAPNMGDLYGMQYNAQMNNYNQQMQNNQANMGGLFGVAGNVASALPWATWFSDERIKEDIKEIGELPNGIKVYEFRYIGRPEVFTGFLAQQVEKIVPEAVTEIEGVKAVHYGKALFHAAL